MAISDIEAIKIALFPFHAEKWKKTAQTMQSIPSTLANDLISTRNKFYTSFVLLALTSLAKVYSTPEASVSEHIYLPLQSISGIAIGYYGNMLYDYISRLQNTVNQTHRPQ